MGHVKPLVCRSTQKHVFIHKCSSWCASLPIRNYPIRLVSDQFFITYTHKHSRCQITCYKGLFPLMIILQSWLELNHRGIALHRWGVMWYWLLEFVAGIHFFFFLRNLQYKHVGQRDSPGNRFIWQFSPVSMYRVQEILCKMPLTAACCDSFI